MEKPGRLFYILMLIVFILYMTTSSISAKVFYTFVMAGLVSIALILGLPKGK